MLGQSKRLENFIASISFIWPSLVEGSGPQRERSQLDYPTESQTRRKGAHASSKHGWEACELMDVRPY